MIRKTLLSVGVATGCLFSLNQALAQNYCYAQPVVVASPVVYQQSYRAPVYSVPVYRAPLQIQAYRAPVYRYAPAPISRGISIGIGFGGPAYGRGYGFGPGIGFGRYGF